MTKTDEPPFIWSMSAEKYRLAIKEFVRQLAESVSSGNPFPARLIVNLLPFNISTQHARRVQERGDFTFSSNTGSGSRVVRTFSNVGSDFELSISDPVLKDYSVEIPSEWRGTATLDQKTSSLVLNFDPPLLLEIDRLAELGAHRSSFQNLTGMHYDGDAVSSELTDDANLQLKTIIDVSITPGSVRLQYYKSKYGDVISFGGPHVYCGGGGYGPWDPQRDDNWYVYQENKPRGLCSVRQGPMSDQWYVLRFGPGSQSDAEDYFNHNCGTEPPD